jgi:hypothetical protein
MFRYTDDVLSLSNVVDRIYPIEPEKKDTTDPDLSTSFLDLHLEIDSAGRLRTKLYDKRDDFNIPIVSLTKSCWRLSHFRSDDSIVTKLNHCFNSFRVSSILYQGQPDRSHKLWNILSSERYILHMLLLERCYV